MSATSSTGGAQGQAQEKAQVAQEKVQEGAQQAKFRLRDQVDQRSTDAGQQVRSTAEALRSTAEQLRSQDKEQPARAAERAADQAERVGGWLEHSSGDDILRDVEDFGRRQPLAVAVAGVALGFAAARFLKASSAERYASYETHGLSYDGPATRPLPARTDPLPEPRTRPRPGDAGAGLSGGVGADVGTGARDAGTGARDVGTGARDVGTGSRLDPPSDRL